VSGPRTSRRQLVVLRGAVSERDLSIIRQVADLRLMSTVQIQTIHFSSHHHASQRTAARTCQRVLRRLVAHRLLILLERQIGGLYGGSSAAVYALGPVGQRLIELDGPRRRLRRPSLAFVQHTLAIGQLVVALTLSANQGLCEVLSLEPEPRCWRSFSGLGGRQSLRPDLFVALGVGDYEQRWFIEVDQGQEHLPTLLAKCRLYERYYRSGEEQAAHGVAPRTCWVMPNSRQANRLERAIGCARELTEQLFTVTVTERAVTTLTGGAT
jgi:hypothetical protein